MALALAARTVLQAILVAGVVAAAGQVNVTLVVDTIRFVGPGPRASVRSNGNGALPVANPINFTTRAYNGSIPGPTIRVRQGDTLRITLVNRLGADGGAPPGGDPNAFALSNTTNLHLHGLHVSPEGESDNVFREVLPHQTATYTYAIPADHPAGTFWYHPHVHGSASLQQGGGMAGALVVEPSADHARELPPELAAMEEQVVVLQHLCFHTDGQYHAPNPYINHMNVHLYSDDEVDPAPTFTSAGAPDSNSSNGVVLANGALTPSLATMRPGEFVLFRLVAASLSAFLELAVVPQAAAGGPGDAAAPCDVYVVAKDGIWVAAAYLHQRPLLVPGSRVDVAIRCPAAGKFDLVSRPDAPYHPQLEENTVVYSGALATITVVGQPATMQPPSKLPARPRYMADLTNAPQPADTFAVVFFTPGGPMSYGPPFPAFNINRQSWSGDSRDVIRNMTLGKVEEWEVRIDGDETASSNHPFHLHVNPFQVIAIGGNAGNASALDIRVGEWRDTLPIPKYAALTLRFRPDRFVGRALLHCHMVPHQDLGMAAVAVISNASVSHES